MPVDFLGSEHGSDDGEAVVPAPVAARARAACSRSSNMWERRAAMSTLRERKARIAFQRVQVAQASQIVRLYGAQLYNVIVDSFYCAFIGWFVLCSFFGAFIV